MAFDLKEAYRRVQIHQHTGIFYDLFIGPIFSILPFGLPSIFKALPFGLPPMPQMFANVLVVLLAPLRQSMSNGGSTQETQTTVQHCEFIVNFDKPSSAISVPASL